MTITRKTCLITGCSKGGVGAALAEAFNGKGYHVFVTARSVNKIPQTLHDASDVTVLALDVSSSESITAIAKAVQTQTGGKLDVLVNNAGLGLETPILDTFIAEAKKVFDVNFFGALEMIQVFSPMLVNAGGCIVNNSSVGGRFPIPFIGVYIRLKTLDRKFRLISKSRHLPSNQSSTYPSKRGLASGNCTSRRTRPYSHHRRRHDKLPG